MKILEKLLAETTPGPWECGKGAGWFIKREGRRSALMVGMSAECSIISDGQVTERGSSGPECKANARLMALAPSLAAALLVAEKALRAYEAYESVPADRGGKSGPKGKAWQAFLDAKAAALSEIAKLTGGGE